MLDGVGVAVWDALGLSEADTLVLGETLALGEAEAEADGVEESEAVPVDDAVTDDDAVGVSVAVGDAVGVCVSEGDGVGVGDADVVEDGVSLPVWLADSEADDESSIASRGTAAAPLGPVAPAGTVSLCGASGCAGAPGCGLLAMSWRKTSGRKLPSGKRALPASAGSAMAKPFPPLRECQLAQSPWRPLSRVWPPRI